MNIHRATHTKTFKRNIILGILSVVCVNFFFAQNRLSKLEKEFSFAQLPLFKLNASHTQIIFSSWDKSTIGIKAYSAGDVGTEYLKNINDLWEIQIQSSDSILILNTDASRQMPEKVITTNINSGNQLNMLLKSMLEPMLLDSQNKIMPALLQKRLAELQFDFDAYNKEGEVYLKNWEDSLVQGLDKNTTQEVYNWSKQVSTQLTNNTPPVLAETNRVVFQFYKKYKIKPTVLVNKIIELKIPQKSLSYITARYGSFTLTNTVTNIQAKLKYTPFKAERIDGRFTNVKISSAPVQVKQWSRGKLQLHYVKSGEIQTVDKIDLLSNSSRFLIHSLNNKGTFQTNFSQLGVDNISANFSEINFTSSNSDIVMSIPKPSFNFVYSGEMSQIKMPPNILELKSLGDYKNLMLHGYSKSSNSKREIQMNVLNSQIILK